MRVREPRHSGNNRPLPSRTLTAFSSSRAPGPRPTSSRRMFPSATSNPSSPIGRGAAPAPVCRCCRSRAHGTSSSGRMPKAGFFQPQDDIPAVSLRLALWRLMRPAAIAPPPPEHADPMPRAKTQPKVRNLIVVLGDQLSPSIASLAAADPRQDLVLMCEVAEETTYVRHHKKKIILLFSAMRHFAKELTSLGWRVAYTKLDDPGNAGSFTGEVARTAATHKPAPHHRNGTRRMARPRRDRYMGGRPECSRRCPGRHALHLFDRDICRLGQGPQATAHGVFYREMRRETGLLMDGDRRKAAPGTSMRRTASGPKTVRALPDQSGSNPTRSRARCWRWWAAICLPSGVGAVLVCGYARRGSSRVKAFLETRAAAVRRLPRCDARWRADAVP